MKQRINVTVSATLCLNQACLEALLKNDHEINITGLVRSPQELGEKLHLNLSDVIVLYLMNNEINYIDRIPDWLQINSRIRFVVLLDPNNEYDQMEALKMGVAGIVGLNQTTQGLIRAIKQVYEGNTFLSQKLINRLLRPACSLKSGSNKSYTKIDELTTREYEIIDVILMGMTNKKISEKLFISEATVRHHLSSIYSKLYINGRLNLVIYAYQNGLVRKQERAINMRKNA